MDISLDLATLFQKRYAGIDGNITILTILRRTSLCRTAHGEARMPVHEGIERWLWPFDLSVPYPLPVCSPVVCFLVVDGQRDYAVVGEPAFRTASG